MLVTYSPSPMVPSPNTPPPLPLSPFPSSLTTSRNRKQSRAESRMERHTCKLCFRRFSNGRALGGHMRSHVASAAAATATNNPKPQLQDSSASPSSFSSASLGEPEAAEQVADVADQAAALLGTEEEVGGGEEEKQLVYYGLRENPKKSYRFVDPEFSSTFKAADYVAGHGGGGSSVVLQARESETESSMSPSLRRRFKRCRRTASPPLPKTEPSFEPEPVSSVSDTTPEEDVARCLMMLSRDTWTTATKKNNSNREVVVEKEKLEEEQQQSDDSEEEERRIVPVRSRRGGRGMYQCGTCRKVFRSYQALGGHRASHKKVKGCITGSTAPPPVVVVEEEDPYYHKDRQIQEADSDANADRRIHECPVCYRIFGSGQALGGHKRSHLAYSSTNPSPPLPNASITNTTTIVAAASSSHATASTTKCGRESLIDLNLPAPMEKVELSAVSHAEE